MHAQLLLTQAREHRLEWGESLVFLKVDIADAFGSISYPLAEVTLSERLGPQHAAQILRVMATQQVRPRWRRWCGSYAPWGRGGRQGSGDLPGIWGIVFDCVLGPLLADWQRRGMGLEVPAIFGSGGGPDNRWDPPLGPADLQAFLTHVAFADDKIIVAKTRAEAATMLSELAAALAPAGLSFQWTKVAGWASDGSTEPLHVDGHDVAMKTSLEILGTRIGRDPAEAWRHREAIAWRRLRANLCRYRAPGLPVSTRLGRLRAEIFSTLLWGAGTWVWSPSLAQDIGCCLVRMARLTLGLRGVSGEGWLDWHRRSMREAREALSRTLKMDPAAWVCTQAAVSVGRLSRAAPGGMLGRAMRWRSRADCMQLEAIRAAAREPRDGAWVRNRRGRPPRRWEQCWMEACGGEPEWWPAAAAWGIPAARAVAANVLGQKC